MTINRDLADSARVPPFRKNLIINGGFDIWQRGTIETSITTETYLADRWFWNKTGSVIVTCQRVTNSGVPEGQVSYLQTTVTTVDTSITAGEYGHIAYQIEGRDCSPNGWHLTDTDAHHSMTLSFWHAHTKTGINCVAFRDDGVNVSYVAEYTQAVADTWEKTTITIPAPTIGTWEVDNGIGLRIAFCTAVGTTYQTTADAGWQSGNYIGTSNQVNNHNDMTNHIRFSGVQLEVGDVVTPFEQRSFAEELALCKRYYQKSFKIADTPADNVDTSQYTGIAVSTTQIRVFIDYEVEMRSFPSLTLYQPSAGSSAGKWAYWNTAWINSSNTTLVLNLQKQFAVDLAVTGRSLGDAFMSAGGWTADAEL